jgi:hypothetical protein
MNQNFKQRLSALEATQQGRPRFPDFTPALMLAYATPDERAAWEAAGQPEISLSQLNSALVEVYADE